MSTPITITIARGSALNYASPFPDSEAANFTWTGQIPSTLYYQTSPSTHSVLLYGTTTAAPGNYVSRLQTVVNGSAIDDWEVTVAVTDVTARETPVISCPAAALVGGVMEASQAAGSLAVQFMATNGPVTWTGSLPDGLNINAAGLVTGSLPIGTHWLTVFATNQEYSGGPNQTASYVVRLVVTQAAPVVTLASGAASLSVTAGSAVEAQFSTQSAAGSVTWAATGLPSGLVLNEATGLLSGSTSAVGARTITITATNATGAGALTTSLVVSRASGGDTAPSYAFLQTDPTLTGVTVDIRTGAVTFARTNPFKQASSVRLAVVFTDQGEPVPPPDTQTIAMGVRPNNQFAADEIFHLADWSTLEATEDDPAYVLAEFTLDGDDLATELQSAIASSNESSAPALTAMADIAWLSSDRRQVSQTFTFGISPTVTY